MNLNYKEILSTMLAVLEIFIYIYTWAYAFFNHLFLVLSTEYFWLFYVKHKIMLAFHVNLMKNETRGILFVSVLARDVVF